MRDPLATALGLFILLLAPLGPPQPRSTMADEYPPGYWQLTADQRTAYNLELVAMRDAENRLRRARTAEDTRVDGCLPSTGRECTRCKKAAVTVNDDGRCDFCAATFVFAFGTGWERAQFVRRGELSVL